jgi:hypothetical protein
MIISKKSIHALARGERSLHKSQKTTRNKEHNKIIYSLPNVKKRIGKLNYGPNEKENREKRKKKKEKREKRKEGNTFIRFKEGSSCFPSPSRTIVPMTNVAKLLSILTLCFRTVVRISCISFPICT